MKNLLVSMVLTLSAFPLAAVAQPPLGAPPVPPGNPITEPKRVLGKILFWDEQLSSSNTVSCGTCHTPEAGGGDARHGRSSGYDGIFLSTDDVFGSPGVTGADGDNNFSPVSGGVRFATQVTPRSSQSAYIGAYSALNFWDGRAGTVFTDPVTGEVVLPFGGALESQAVQPPVSDVEMSHFGRDWTQIVAKLAASSPLALADQLPTDVVNALADKPSYPILFQRAFGTSEVTAARVAMAIATYERTLVPNQTPWDRYAAGNASALTPQQIAGLNAFRSEAAKCTDCHTGNLFTDNAFHNIGVRPYFEDPGRESVTGVFADRGKFKTPTLRNVGLRPTFFHNGRTSTLRQAVEFYSRAPGSLPQFTDNLDPSAVGIVLTAAEVDAIVEFMAVGLTDPRVAASLPPFDKPRLWSLRPGLAPSSLGGGVAGPGQSAPPLMIAGDPAVIGGETRLGVGEAVPGWRAVARVSAAAPVGGVVSGGVTLPEIVITSEGTGTSRLLIDGAVYASGTPLYVQWTLSAAGGGPVIARSDVARIVPFCPLGGCPSTCPADLGGAGGFPTPDSLLDNNDFIVFISLFFAQSPAADIGVAGGLRGSDGAWDNNDFIAFINLFFQGC